MNAKVILLLFVLAQSCAQVFDLDLGGTWQLHNANGSIKADGQVPGEVFTDLMAAKVLGDPYYRYNDVLYRWVGMDNWTYIRDFEAPEEWSRDGHKILLWMEGVDTIADVYINDVKVQSVDNMFRRYQVDIGRVIISGQNTIRVSFTSASTYANYKKNEYPYNVPAGDAFMPPAHGVYNRNFVRKEQSSFGWDWGPAFIPQGIYKPIGIRVVKYATIDYVVPAVERINKDNTAWKVNVSVLIDSNVKDILFLTAQIEGQAEVKQEYQIVEGKNTLYITIQMNNPKLWWPRGYGDANMYALSIKLQDKKGSQVDSHSHKIGFRTVKLNTDKIPGRSGENYMYFEVNDLAIFAKGANVVPSDSFEGRVTEESLRYMLQTAADTNMNMIRVWGGGLYQSDAFYQMTDELGLMVWQELMFACSNYPRDTDFLENVREEVKHQIRRLGHHVSIVLWSGNNENEWQMGSDARQQIIDYSILYFETIYAAIIEVDNLRPFWPSSPSNGFIDMDMLAGRWGFANSVKQGDAHYYDYSGLCTNVSKLPNMKFASEYGIQSQESLYSYDDVTITEDLSRNSHLMNFRQHQPGGQSNLEHEVGQHFKLAKDTAGREQFTQWSYLSQSMQSLCIKAQTEHYRRGRGLTSKNMGALYWQLNSIWQAPTWSSTEYGGRWKMLQYFSKNFFAPVLVSTFEQDGNFFVHVTSDQNMPVKSVAVMTLHTWAGETLKSWKFPAVMKPLESREIYNSTLKDVLSGHSHKDVFLTIELRDGKGELLSSNNQFFTVMKEINLQDPKHSVSSVTLDTKRSVKMTVSSQASAPYTWLSTKTPGRFSENGFLMLKGESRTVFFTSDVDISDVKAFSDTLRVMSVFETQK